MADRHVAPVSQWSEPRSGARMASAAFLKINGDGDFEISDTGPNEAYFAVDGSGDITIEVGGSPHERASLKINDDYYL